GYIQYIDEGDKGLKKVKTFTEKPNMELAKMFLQSGDFVWNSGIFIWHVKSILAAFEQHLPELSEIFDEGVNSFYSDREEAFISRAYAQCRNISIDYGVMEKAGNVYVMLSDFGWSDLGTWNSLYSMSDKDEQGNVIGGNVLTYDTYNCIIKTPKERLVVVQGLEEYIIAEHDNVLMICRLEDEQMVKEFVADVKSKKGQEYI
ncbi:MAG: mannose-1-phosphate guanylyltransferase, partial [Chitinophagaceae bacterium]